VANHGARTRMRVCDFSGGVVLKLNVVISVIEQSVIERGARRLFLIPFRINKMTPHALSSSNSAFFPITTPKLCTYTWRESPSTPHKPLPDHAAAIGKKEEYAAQTPPSTARTPLPTMHAGPETRTGRSSALA
jgi:hypothetical protein